MPSLAAEFKHYRTVSSKIPHGTGNSNSGTLVDSSNMTLFGTQEMAEGRISRSKKPADIEEAKSILSQAGGVATSGLHTLGSVLSAPSRNLYGTINGALGLQGGYGNRSLTDSTGGIEAADLLENMGLHPKNDPTKWEWHDFSRLGINILGDPLSYMAPLGLTKKGVDAAKAGALSKGVLNQIRNSERGLVGFQKPLAGWSSGAIGTGQDVAQKLTDIGNTKITRNSTVGDALRGVAESKPVRIFRAKMDVATRGKLHPAIQRYSKELDAAEKRAVNESRRDMLAMAYNMKKAGLHSKEDGELLRDIVEEVGMPKPGDQMIVPHGTQYMPPGATPEHMAMSQRLQQVNDANLDNLMKIGVATGEMAGDDVKHFARHMSSGIKPKGYDAVTTDKIQKALSRKDLWKNLGGTNNINRILTNKNVDAAIKQAETMVDPAAGTLITQGAKGFGRRDAVKAAHDALVKEYPQFDKKQLGKIANLLVHVPAMREQGLYGNHLLHDLFVNVRHSIGLYHNAVRAYKAIGDTLTHQAGGNIRVGHFLAKHGFDPQTAAEHIAGMTGKNADEVLRSYMPRDLAKELHTLTPAYKSPPADQEINSFLKQFTNVFKGNVLAVPASRFRDAASGGIQNAMLRHLNPTGWNDARNVTLGKSLGKDYSHLKEVKSLMDRHNLTSDEAVRVILGAEAPRASGFLADTTPGQIGTGLQDIVDEIPGYEPSGVLDTFKRAGKSLLHGELDRAGNPINPNARWRDVANPLNISGVGERTSTGAGHVAASNVLAGASDEFNRHAGILSQMNDLVEPSVAGAKTRAAQVDYSPESFTPTESQWLKQVFPFYSFGSRMLGHTAKELAARPGGATAQLVKELDRNQATDPALPNSVLESMAMPVETLPDGTKRLATGLGLMPEQSVKQIGDLLGGDTRNSMYTLAGQLNPLLRAPLEHMTQTSFYKRGEPTTNLDPVLGRMASDIGVMAGLRDKDAGPVTFPGSSVLESAARMSPISRQISTARQLTDTRKDAGTKILNTLTGAHVTDIGPKKQAATLLKRAQELAQKAGARVRSDVYFNKEELERLARYNPELAEQQRKMQALLKALNIRPQSTKSVRRAKSGD